MCKSTIYLFATNIASVQPLCWKVLLHMFMNGENFHSVETFAKSLAYLISKCEFAVLGTFSFGYNSNSKHLGNRYRSTNRSSLKENFYS